MSRFNSVPVIVQQSVERLRDPSTPENVKFNIAQSLQTISEYVEIALNDWDKVQAKKKR